MLQTVQVVCPALARPAWVGNVDVNAAPLARLKCDVAAHFNLPDDAELDIGFTTGQGAARTVRLVRTDLQLATFLKLVQARRLTEKNGIPSLRVLTGDADPNASALTKRLNSTFRQGGKQENAGSTCHVPIALEKDFTTRLVYIPRAVLTLARKGSGGGLYKALRSLVSDVYSPSHAIAFSTSSSPPRKVDIDDEQSARVFARLISKNGLLKKAVAAAEDPCAGPVLVLAVAAAPPVSGVPRARPYDPLVVADA